MVEKKTYIITHIILWILIPLILFPIIWVVSTSIRRDEAAFSTKLFSSRVSLQNYKDLLAPEKNIPALIQELQNLILMTPPYDNWSKQKIEKEIEKDIEALNNYLRETKDRYNLVNSSFIELNNFMNSKVENIKNDVGLLLETLKTYLEKNLPEEGVNKEDLKVVLYNLYKHRKISNDKIFRIFHKELELNLDSKGFLEISIFKESYDRKLGNLERKLEEINEKLRTNREIYSKTLRDYDSIQQRILSINKLISEDIEGEVSYLKEYSELKIAKNFHDFSFASYKGESEFSNKIFSIVDRLAKYKDFYKTYENLKQLIKWSEVSKDSYLQKSLIKISDKIGVLLDSLEASISEMKDYNMKLAILKQENEFLEMQKELLQDEEENVQEELRPTTKYAEIKIFINSLEEKLNTLNNINALNEIIRELSGWEGEFRDFITSYIINYGRDNLSNRIEAAADRLKWFSDYSTFYDKAQIFFVYLSGTLEKASKLLEEIKDRWRDYFSKSLKGEKANIIELDNLYNIVKTDYVNFVSSNMNIVSKKAGDLIDSIPFREAKRWLSRIDSEIFRVDQIWKQKTKHYFLKWVRNSVLVAGIAAVITTLICSLAAYPFSRMRFWGRRYGILTLLLIQMFPSAVYMIAIYSLLNILGRFIPFLGLDTLSGLTFVYLGNIAYNMYLIKGYYDTIPDSLEESAMIDGATRFQTFYKIVFPLARPILTVVVILTFMNIFNEFIFARIILQDAQKYTYAIGLWTFSSGPYQTEWGLFTAAALLGMLPMTVLFLSLQKYIVSGLTKGAVKG